MGIDFAKLTTEAQAEADDASCDWRYVRVDGTAPTLPSVMGFHLDDPDKTEARLQALKFMAVEIIKIWRANGGIGRGAITCRPAEDGAAVVYACHAQTSMQQVFEELKAA